MSTNLKSYVVGKELHLTGYELFPEEDGCRSKSWEFIITSPTSSTLFYIVNGKYMEQRAQGGVDGMEIVTLDSKEVEFGAAGDNESALGFDLLKSIPECALREMVLSFVAQSVGMCYGTAGWQYQADTSEKAWGWARVFGSELTLAIDEFAKSELNRIYNR